MNELINERINSWMNIPGRFFKLVPNQISLLLSDDEMNDWIKEWMKERINVWMNIPDWFIELVLIQIITFTIWWWNEWLN